MQASLADDETATQDHAEAIEPEILPATSNSGSDSGSEPDSHSDISDQADSEDEEFLPTEYGILGLNWVRAWNDVDGEEQE